MYPQTSWCVPEIPEIAAWCVPEIAARDRASQFSKAVRKHWGIETTCHWSLDVTCGEDGLRTRQRTIAENLAWLRRFTLLHSMSNSRREFLIATAAASTNILWNRHGSGPAETGPSLVADDTAGEADQNRGQSHPARKVRDVPTGRGGRDAKRVRRDSGSDRATGDLAAVGHVTSLGSGSKMRTRGSRWSRSAQNQRLTLENAPVGSLVWISAGSGVEKPARNCRTIDTGGGAMLFSARCELRLGVRGIHYGGLPQSWPRTE